jgi:hypothetical protein
MPATDCAECGTTWTYQNSNLERHLTGAHERSTAVAEKKPNQRISAYEKARMEDGVNEGVPDPEDDPNSEENQKETGLSEQQQKNARERVRIDAGGDKGITDDDKDSDKYDKPSKPAEETGAKARVEAAADSKTPHSMASEGTPADTNIGNDGAARLVALENEIRVTEPGSKRNGLIEEFKELGGNATPYEDPTPQNRNPA